MSEELVGRARGRARGRSRMQPTSAPQPRRPGVQTSSQLLEQQQQQQQPLPQQEPMISRPPELIGRARGTRQVEQVRQQMGALSLAAESGPQGEGSASVPSRGGVRARRYDEPQVPTRPSTLASKQGTSGVPVTLRSNYFKLQTHTDWALYQYRVDFAPDEDRTGCRKGLLRVHKDILGPYMFDGTVLFTMKRLESDPLELYSARLSDDVKIRITIKKTTDLVLGDPHYIQFFNIVLRKCIAGLNLQLVGRDYFDAASKVIVEKYNLELWPGFVTSIRQHENDILLGIDLANKIMRKDTALNLLNDLSQRSEGWKDLFVQAIVGATIITPYNNKTYRVDDVDFDSSPLSTFEKGNERVTYMDYYRNRYSIKITNKAQPLLISRPKKRDIHAGRTNNVVLIPELCCLTGLSEDMRNNFHLMRDLEEHTRLHPSARMDKIVHFMRRLTTNEQAKGELSLWNLKFAPDLVEFTGRILVPEKIQHGGGMSSDGSQDADWTRNLRGHPMYHSKEFNNWTIVYLRKAHRDVESFVRTLTNASSSLQFKIPPPNYEDLPDDRAGTYVQAIEKIISRNNPQLIMCIVPNNRPDRYSAIKKKCCVDRAVPSQVVLAKNLTTKNVMSIATKIGIQVNCKIGGSPWSVVVPFKKPVMVVGFDVCHDSSIKARSFAAMVASLDGSYSKYYSAVSPHTSGQELSNDLGMQVQKAVLVYRDHNGFYPPKLIVYRDGVGEGQEHYVLQHEVEPLRAKLQEYYQSEPLQMAFIIVTKRVNTRVFMKGNNPPPGTIVDDVITNPIKYDFYLVSQQVRQGTVTPTLYNVIYDTTHLSPDIMQKLSYKMCHLYFNWAGTVRVPAPVQYAHKLAFLCGQHLHRAPNQQLSELLYFL
uniref:Putative translation initiation factor 2c eif-2c n=1 Tax=Panstrongylus lignarius TaxID=156445 RepID=A0A224X701_9HEMI